MQVNTNTKTTLTLFRRPARRPEQPPHYLKARRSFTLTRRELRRIIADTIG